MGLTVGGVAGLGYYYGKAIAIDVDVETFEPRFFVYKQY